MHDYLFRYCPLAGILFEVLRIGVDACEIFCVKHAFPDINLKNQFNLTLALMYDFNVNNTFKMDQTTTLIFLKTNKGYFPIFLTAM